MNESFHQIVNRWVSAIITVCTILSVNFTIPVLAEEDNTVGNSNKDNLTWILNNPYQMSKASYTAAKPYVRIRYGTSNTNSLVTTDTVYAVTYRVSNSSNTSYGSWYTLIFSYSDTPISNGQNNNNVNVDNSSDKLNWTNFASHLGLSSIYTANVEGAKSLIYANVQQNSTYSQIGYYFGDNMPNDCPRISLNYGQNHESILYLFSTEDFSYVPWNFSTSSGGLHFDDGSELSPSDTSTYRQVYLIMDTNNDNSVSQEEVNYYNYTYNTNYDYSEINNNQDFSQLEFLNWIALQIANGNDNPGGGSGSGGGSNAIGGGITVGDGSFTQSQTQTQSIAENAVSVTVNNNNELSQENSQYLNNIINNNLGTEGNAFENAIGNVNGFVSVARSFSSLVGVVLGFLPAWVTTLLSLMFTILFVMIIFRLIHLFV